MNIGEISKKLVEKCILQNGTGGRPKNRTWRISRIKISFNNDSVKVTWEITVADGRNHSHESQRTKAMVYKRKRDALTNLMGKIQKSEKSEKSVNLWDSLLLDWCR